MKSTRTLHFVRGAALAPLTALILGHAFAATPAQAAGATATAAAPVKVLVDVGNQDEALRLPTMFAWRNAVDRALKIDARKARYIDTRNDAEFAEAHVPGATLIPYVEKSLKDAEFNPKDDLFNVVSLGADKNAVLVFGCNGPECWKSHKASIAAIKAGYTHVNWFRGGVPDWRGAGLPIDTGAH